MINENNEVIITTADAFSVIAIINKLGLKNDITGSIKEYVSLNKQKENTLLEIRKLIENYDELNNEEKVEATDNILIDNKEIKDKLENIQSKTMELGSNLIFTFIERLPQAEKEVYKCLAKIYGKTVKDIEIQPIQDTINMITKIGTSSTIMGFFN